MKRNLVAYFLTLILLLPGISLLAQERPNFINLVTVGDSISAGFISGVLKEEGQIHSYPALISRQVGTFHFLPLMPDPGVGQEIHLEDGLPVMGPITGGTTSRGFPLIVPQNLAIPGQDVLDALTSRPDFADPSKPFENLILGVPITAIFGQSPVSQIELAVGLSPSFTLFWLGSNDVLKTVTSGVDPTPVAAFQQAYGMAAGALLTLTNTRLIVANIPDETLIPFLTSAVEVAQLAGAPLALIGPLLGISDGDFVRPGGVFLIESILRGQIAGPIPESEILRAERVTEIRNLTAQMNGFISGAAAQFGVPVVDIHSILADIDANGYTLSNGQVLTTAFLGGIFSLDGVHPTYTGQAIVANAFIQKMNEFWELQIPQVNVDEVAASDPLIFSGVPAEARLNWLGRAGPLLEASAKVLGAGRNSAGRQSFDPGQDPGVREEITAQSLEEYLQTEFRHIRVSPGPMPLSLERRPDPRQRERIASTPLP